VRTTALDAGSDLHVAKPCTPAKLAEILALSPQIDVVSVVASSTAAVAGEQPTFVTQTQQS
jgi:hypothetical protein